MIVPIMSIGRAAASRTSHSTLPSHRLLISRFFLSRRRLLSEKATQPPSTPSSISPGAKHSRWISLLQGLGALSSPSSKQAGGNAGQSFLAGSRRLAGLAAPEKSRLICAGGLLLISSGVTLSVPYIFGSTIDTINKCDIRGLCCNSYNDNNIAWSKIEKGYISWSPQQS